MDFNYYKHCIVPQCINTTIKTPKKLFFHVPKNKQIRKKWLQLARRDTNVSSSSRMYFCEDHFDLPNDMSNYIQYQVMGSVSQLRLKPGCLPGKFDCQPDRKKRTCSSLTRPYILKKQRMMIIEECLNESVESNTGSARLIPENTSDTNPVFPKDEEDLPGLRTENKCVQVLITHKYGSKDTQASIKLMDRLSKEVPSIKDPDTDGQEEFEHCEMERLKLEIDEDKYEISYAFDTLADIRHVEFTTQPPEVKTEPRDDEYLQCCPSAHHVSNASHFAVKTKPTNDDYNMEMVDILSYNTTSDIATHYDVTQNIATYVTIKAESPFT